MTITNGAPVASAGARPSLKTLGKLGVYSPVFPRGLAELDVVLYERSAYCVVKKSARVYRGSYITLRELGTNAVRSVRIEPHVKLSRLNLRETVAGTFEGRVGYWKRAVGDVVIYPGKHVGDSVVAVRTAHGWFRTAAPWMPFADAEVSYDVVRGQARMIRTGLRMAVLGSESPFVVGSVVATRSTSRGEPSVWFRKSRDHWVGNTRGVTLSDQMIRYELDRNTYQMLHLPEDR